MKIRFHVLGKRGEEIWSLVKIFRVHNIFKDVLFKGVLQNYRFYAVQENNVAFDFLVADFPLMNLHDLICVARIFKVVDVSKLQITSKEDFLIGFCHIKLFIDNYYSYRVLTYVELALAMEKQIIVPQSLMKIQAILKGFEDVEICLKPLGNAFIGKNKKGKNIKFLFQSCDGERYTYPHYTNLIVRMNSCVKNNDGNKVEIKKIINQYAEVQRTIYKATQMMMT